MYLETEAAIELVGVGYAGKGVWRNRTEGERILGHGPLPRGRYRIGAPADSATVGKYALRLTPLDETYGRSAFLIHGDNGRGDFSASSGCIILPRNVRERISGGPRTLIVDGSPRAEWLARR